MSIFRRHLEALNGVVMLISQELLHGKRWSMLAAWVMSALACGGQLGSDAGRNDVDLPASGAGGSARTTPAPAPVGSVLAVLSDPQQFAAVCVAMCNHIIAPCGGSTAFCVQECVTSRPSKSECLPAFGAYVSCMLTVKVECSAKSLITVEGCDAEREDLLTC